jgi:hypothetical protein
LIVSITAGEDAMGLIEDVFKVLDRIPIWGRLQKAG